jgi:disulfide oxidoreductase YuzD
LVNSNLKSEKVMSKLAKQEIKWLDIPEEKDYLSAASYSSLIYDSRAIEDMLDQLRSIGISSFKAKDLFRASGLSILGISNSHVRKDARKIKTGDLISPLLLVRDQVNGKVIIADGYHRLCAVYRYDEDALIPCKIV